MNQHSQYPVTLTQFTETGAALAQLNIRGYVDIAAARHLIAEGLAEPERIHASMDTFPSKIFEGISLTLAGSLASRKLEQQMTPVAGLTDTPQFIAGPELADSQRAVTSSYLKWLGKDHLSQLDRQFAQGWCADIPGEDTEVIDIPLPRRKLARAGKI